MAQGRLVFRAVRQESGGAGAMTSVYYLAAPSLEDYQHQEGLVDGCAYCELKRESNTHNPSDSKVQ